MGNWFVGGHCVDDVILSLMLISGLHDDEAKLVNWLQHTPLWKYSLPPDSLLCSICKQRRLAVCSMYRINKSSSYQRLCMYLKNLSNCHTM